MIKKNAFLILTTFLMVFCLSCPTRNTSILTEIVKANKQLIKANNYPNLILPKQSFVKLETTATLQMCQMTIKGDRFVRNCKQKPDFGEGSGVIIKKTPNGSLISTAAHVCKIRHFKFETIEQFNKIQTQTGKFYKTKLIEIDRKNDICIILAKDLKNLKPVQLSPVPPKIGDYIYNIAAPEGLYKKDFMLIYEGFYAGDKNKRSYYSSFAANGSSGSMVLNHRGLLIGIITHTYRGVHASIGPRYEALMKTIHKAFKKVP